MSHSSRFPFRIVNFLLICSLAGTFFLVQSPAPAYADGTTPTPVPTLVPPADETAQATPVPQPAAAPRLKLYQDIVLDYIKMTSRTEGWGITGQTILTTVNAGLTWHEATPPEPIPEGSEVTAYGAFLNAKTAWVIYAINGQINPEASVWHTTDKGLTWTPGAPLNHQAFGDKLWAEFTVLDANTLWIMIRGVYAGAGMHYDHRLYSSTDGGLTWNFLPSEFSDDYTGMSFADASSGIRTLQTTDPYDAAPPAFEITLDGGAIWEKRELPPPPDEPDLFTRFAYCETYQPVALPFQSYRLLVGCFDNLNPHKLFEGYFYSSKNGGSTWTFGKLPVKARADIGQLVYFDAKTIYLLGKDSFRSTDDGMKWSYLKVVNWDGQFSFPDPQNGWAIARFKNAVSLVKTSNRAATWKIVLPRIVR